MRTRTKRSIGGQAALAAAVAAMLVSPAGAQTGPPAPAPPTPPAPTLPPPVDDESVNVAPPVARKNVKAPYAALARAAADLQRVAATSAPAKRALRAVQRAQHGFAGTPSGLRPTNLTDTTRALVSAQRALTSVTGSRLRRRIERATARRLTATGRLIATTLLKRAVASGAAGATIRAVRARRARGDRLARAGDHAGAAGLYGQAVKLASNGLVFDIARFEKNVRGFFDSQTTGYSYAIVRTGKLYSAKGAGFARTPADGGTPYSPTTEMNIASVTKTITAAAVLKLIQKNGMAIDESVAPWLPKQWLPKQGPILDSIEDLTFEDLMTHKSGLGANNVGGSRLDKLEAAVAKGIDPADKVGTYQNANFAIFRVIIPALLGVDIYAHETKPADVVAAETYVNYLKTEVFDQDGLLPDCKPQDPKFGGPTLAYPFPDDGKPGLDPGDWSLGCGGGGLYLSAVELARFHARLRFTNEIIDPIRRKLMNDKFLGYNEPTGNLYTWNNGAFGVYRSHGGDLDWGSRGVNTCAIDYPIAIQAVVLINSTGGNYPYQCSALVQAFDAAWVAK